MSRKAKAAYMKRKKKRIKAGLCSERGCPLDDKRFKTCSKCREKSKKNNRKHWANAKVINSRTSDRRNGFFKDVVPKDFIDKEWVLKTREEQQNKCTTCAVVLQTENMKLHDGLTIDRKDDGLPHLKSNCVINCWKCNTRRVLGLDLWLAKRRAEVAAMIVDN